jgi:uncharacterized protein (DUF983 family)
MTMEVINLKVMQSNAEEKKPSILNIVRCKCPRCRKGEMFIEKNPYKLKTMMKMNERCPVCGQPFDLEVGFYFGSSYVSYAFAVALSAVTFVAWRVLIGFTLHDNRIFYWLVFNAVFLIALQPVLMRIARAIWLALFVRYDMNWRTNPAGVPERINEDQKNNW